MSTHGYALYTSIVAAHVCLSASRSVPSSQFARAFELGLSEQQRVWAELAPAAQRRTVQGRMYGDWSHVWGVPVHACPRQRAGVPAGTARAGGGVSVSAATDVCRSAYGPCCLGFDLTCAVSSCVLLRLSRTLW
jgi:hypothetical protein